MRYAFIKGHHHQFSARRRCNMLTVHPSGFYAWLKRYAVPPATAVKEDQAAEIRRLKQELSRVTEERDILKKATAYFTKDAK